MNVCTFVRLVAEDIVFDPLARQLSRSNLQLAASMGPQQYYYYYYHYKNWVAVGGSSDGAIAGTVRNFYSWFLDRAFFHCCRQARTKERASCKRSSSGNISSLVVGRRKRRMVDFVRSLGRSLSIQPVSLEELARQSYSVVNRTCVVSVKLSRRTVEYHCRAANAT